MRVVSYITSGEFSFVSSSRTWCRGHFLRTFDEVIESSKEIAKHVLLGRENIGLFRLSVMVFIDSSLEALTSREPAWRYACDAVEVDMLYIKTNRTNFPPATARENYSTYWLQALLVPQACSQLNRYHQTSRPPWNGTYKSLDRYPRWWILLVSVERILSEKKPPKFSYTILYQTWCTPSDGGI